MRKNYDQIRPEELIRADITTHLSIPFYSSLVACGFPSPATDHIEKVCDLNELCITNQDATYFVRAAGDSMMGAGLGEGDVMVVDRSYEDHEGRIVVVWLNGEYTVKWFYRVKEMIVLLPDNPKYLPIYVHPGDVCRVFGVVTNWVKKAPTRKPYPL